MCHLFENIRIGANGDRKKKKRGCEKKTRAPRTLYFKLKASSVYSIISIIVDKVC